MKILKSSVLDVLKDVYGFFLGQRDGLLWSFMKKIDKFYSLVISRGHGLDILEIKRVIIESLFSDILTVIIKAGRQVAELFICAASLNVTSITRSISRA